MTQETEPRRMLDAFQRMGLRRVALKLGKNGAALLGWQHRLQKPGTTHRWTLLARAIASMPFFYAWLGE